MLVPFSSHHSYQVTGQSFIAMAGEKALTPCNTWACSTCFLSQNGETTNPDWGKPVFLIACRRSRLSMRAPISSSYKLIHCQAWITSLLVKISISSEFPISRISPSLRTVLAVCKDSQMWS
eukprot:c4077_g1_i1 orf=184-546(+)